MGARKVRGKANEKERFNSRINEEFGAGEEEMV